MLIKALSIWEARNTRLLPDAKYISILNPDANESVWRGSNVLELRFADCEHTETWEIPPGSQNYVEIQFTPRMARSILEFVQPDDPVVIVHCHAGVARSGAVVEALNEIFNRNANPSHYATTDAMNRNRVPNRMVRRLLLEEHARMLHERAE